MAFDKSVTRIIITPRKAKTMLRDNTYKSQRPIRDKRVAELVKKMKDGRFLIGNIAFAHFPDGSCVLMNGQHQLTAVVESKATIQAAVQAFTLKNGKLSKIGQEDLAIIWGQFDEGGMRNAADIALPYANAYGLELSRRAASALASALGAEEWGYNASRNEHTKDERARLFKKNVDVCEFVAEVAFSSDYRPIQRVPVVHAMILTYRKNKRDAKEFWSQVRDGELLKRDDPAFKLREFLSGCTTYKRYSINTKAQAGHATWQEIEHKCIHAWNAFRRKETLKVLKFHPSKAVPQVA